MTKPLLMSDCPICGKKSDITEKPFCSKRCREIDLKKWLDGSYAIEANDQTHFSEPGNDN